MRGCGAPSPSTGCSSVTRNPSGSGSTARTRPVTATARRGTSSNGGARDVATCAAAKPTAAAATVSIAPRATTVRRNATAATAASASAAAPSHSGGSHSSAK